MDPNEKEICDSIIVEYQEALANAQFGLARANGMLKVKDKAISQMLAKIDEIEKRLNEPPKPGPPAVR